MRWTPILFSIVCCVGLPMLAQPAPGQTAQLKAFPGAEGYGSFAVGGRGGDVYFVTNLNNSGPGSLRFGLENASGARTVVFEVGGIIELNSNVRVRNKSTLTIAGQTAPGDGILLRGGMLQFEDCSHLIVRHLRVRYGWDTGAEYDAVDNRSVVNSIFDHISASWGMDETFSLTKNTTNVTVQNCLIAEGSKDGHQYAMLIDTETPGGGRISLIGNLFINHLGRMPRASSGTNQEMVLDMVNNVIYNWSTLADWGVQGTALNPESRSNWNFINNYSIAGRNTGSDYYRQSILRGGSGVDRFYISGNKCDSNVNGVLDGVDAGWEYVRENYVAMETPFSVPEWARVGSLKSADDILEHVVDNVGAYPRRRDAVDERLIDELTSWGTKGFVVTYINRPEWPTLGMNVGPPDTDRDGKPDYWEEWYGTDPASPTNNLKGQGGYTVLEVYLQWLVDPDSVHALGDVNGDNAVDTDDLFPLLVNWGETGKTWSEGDLDGDGRVDFRDLAILARRWKWEWIGPVEP